jgi:hypothetical protein
MYPIHYLDSSFKQTPFAFDILRVRSGDSVNESDAMIDGQMMEILRQRSNTAIGRPQVAIYRASGANVLSNYRQ